MLDYKVRTFLTLCKYMNYRISAEKLNMAQPSVTQHIHLLEDYYSTKLFIYNKKTLIKTDSAKILEKHLKSIVDNEKELERELQNTKIKEIKIGVTKTIGNYVLKDKIISLINDKSSITYIIDNTKALFDKLNENILDLLVIEGLFDKSLYDYKLFRNEEIVGICTKNHIFANKEIDLKDIFTQGLLLREEGSGTRNILEQELFKKNYTINSFKSVHFISSFEIIKDVIRKSQYITFAYKSILNDSNELSTFSIKDINIDREFNYVCLKNTNIEKKILNFYQS